MARFLFRCANCSEEVEIHRNGFRPDVSTTSCPKCATTMLESVIEHRGVAQGEREGRRARAGSGYHATLARFPGDPEAHVETPGQLQKLVDKRRREGWGDPIRGEDVAKQERKGVDKAQLRKILRGEV